MLKSMTAYAQAKIVKTAVRISVEISSVNRRHLDFKLSIPAECRPIEPKIQKVLAEKIHRGMIHLSLKIEWIDQSPIQAIPNIALAKEIRAAWEEIGSALAFPLTDHPALLFNLLSKNPDLIQMNQTSDPKDFEEEVLQVISSALEDLDRMKIEEGKALARDLSQRISSIEKSIAMITPKVPEVIQAYRDKLKTVLIEAFNAPLSLDDQDRILREAALYAEKVDIEEELIRLASHLDQLRQYITSHSLVSGKSIEFLIQEIHREANTIGSKLNDLAVKREVLEMKGEIERIREQIQNLE